MATDDQQSTDEEGSQHPLAPVCALCGHGYHPNLQITIADEGPSESAITGEWEYRWTHDQCKRDHDRVVFEAFTDGGERQ